MILGLTGQVSQQKRPGLQQCAGLGGARCLVLWRRGNSQECSEEEAVVSSQEDQGGSMQGGGAWKDWSRTFPFPISSVHLGLLSLLQMVREPLCSWCRCQGQCIGGPTLWTWAIPAGRE